ncbi:hypothetical protein MRB53_037400 [Persea americana]|nr:hypothetical protein MRB53_037400 [Persea americana]
MACPQYQYQRPAYGHCDTFFVEQEEQGIFARRAAAREEKRAVNRDRQRSIANHLSNLACEEYRDDVLQHMEQMEVSEVLPAILRY